MAALGVDDSTWVVAYDTVGGMYAARLWWMLRWAGHAGASVLDGGLAAWQAEGGAIVATPALARAPGSFTLRPPLTATLGHAEVLANLASADKLVMTRERPTGFAARTRRWTRSPATSRAR